MAQIQQLLKYQEADSKLLKIEQEVANCEERKKFVQTRNFLTKASEKLDQLEAKAQELKSLMDRLNEKYGEISETLKDFDNLDELVDGGADISFYKRSAQNITDKIKSLKGEIASLTSAVKEASEEYQNLKKKVITAQKQYPDLQKAFQDYKKSRQDEISSITSEMEAIARAIRPRLIGNKAPSY